MDQNPFWEANSFLSTEDILNFLINSHVHYLIHKSTSLAPMLSQINPGRSLPECFSDIHFTSWQSRGKKKCVHHFKQECMTPLETHRHGLHASGKKISEEYCKLWNCLNFPEHRRIWRHLKYGNVHFRRNKEMGINYLLTS